MHSEGKLERPVDMAFPQGTSEDVHELFTGHLAACSPGRIMWDGPGWIEEMQKCAWRPETKVEWGDCPETDAVLVRLTDRWRQHASMKGQRWTEGQRNTHGEADTGTVERDKVKRQRDRETEGDEEMGRERDREGEEGQEQRHREAKFQGENENVRKEKICCRTSDDPSGQC